MVKKLQLIIEIIKGNAIVIKKRGEDGVDVNIGKRLRSDKGFVISSLFSTLKIIKESV